LLAFSRHRYGRKRVEGGWYLATFGRGRRLHSRPFAGLCAGRATSLSKRIANPVVSRDAVKPSHRSRRFCRVRDPRDFYPRTKHVQSTSKRGMDQGASGKQIALQWRVV
jgi:hypothetical protein